MTDVDSKLEDEAYLAEMAAPTEETDAQVPDEPKEEPKDEPEEDPAQAVVDDIPERKEVIPGYTEDEIRSNFERIDKLQKALDTTNGTYGSRFAEQQATIEKIQEILLSTKGGAFSQEVMERLEEELPELADILFSHETQEEEPEAKPQEPVADERIDTFIQEQTEREQAKELRALTKRHSDWQDIAMFSRDQNGLVIWNDPNFGQFVASLPEDERNTVLNVWDAEFIGDTISKYKETLTPAKEQVQKNKPSLEDAVRPKGLRGEHKPSELDEEEEAFRREMALP